MWRQSNIVNYLKIKNFNPQFIIVEIKDPNEKWGEYFLTIIKSYKINDYSFLINSYHLDPNTDEPLYVIGIINLKIVSDKVRWEFDIKHWNMYKGSNYDWKFDELKDKYENMK